MIMSEKSKQHVDSCRFCWMCHHVCPIGNATGQERNTARARALGISLVNREAIDLSEIIDNIYECATCGGCMTDCVTGWDPVMFTKETRLHAAMDGKLPSYIMTLVENCMKTDNAYGKTTLCSDLSAKIDEHSDKKDTLLYLGVDARYVVCKQGVKAIKVLEKAGVDFTVLADEVASGAQLDFLIGAANETKEQIKSAMKVFKDYKTVVVYDPQDAKLLKQTAKEYGVDATANIVTYTSFVANLIKEGALKVEKTDKVVVYHDPFQLSRDLEETEDARAIISACADLHEMLLNKEYTVWAGNILMAQYIPEVVKMVAKRRIFNATSINEKVIVTASVSEYKSLKDVAEDVEILSIEDLILGE